MAKSVEVIVGGNIRRIRMERGFTKSAVARAVGITVQELDEYEEGKKNAGPVLTANIAGALGVNVIELFKRDD